MNNGSYTELVAAIERTYKQLAEMSSECPLVETVAWQYQQLLEEELRYFGLESGVLQEENTVDTTLPAPPKKERKPWSEEARAAAAERLRARIAAGKMKRDIPAHNETSTA